MRYIPPLYAPDCFLSLYWDRVLYPVENLFGVGEIKATVNGGRSGDDQGGPLVDMVCPRDWPFLIGLADLALSFV